MTIAHHTCHLLYWMLILLATILLPQPWRVRYQATRDSHYATKPIKLLKLGLFIHLLIQSFIHDVFGSLSGPGPGEMLAWPTPASSSLPCPLDFPELAFLHITDPSNMLCSLSTLHNASSTGTAELGFCLFCLIYCCAYSLCQCQAHCSSSVNSK